MTDPIDRSGTVNGMVRRIMAPYSKAINAVDITDRQAWLPIMLDEIRAVLREIMGCPHDGACACTIFTRHELMEENARLRNAIQEAASILRKFT